MNMQPVSRFFLCSAGILLFVVGGQVSAEGVSESNYAESRAGKTFIQALSDEHGFERAELTRWLGQAERQDGILKSISTPAEKTLEWHEYRRIFIRDEQIKDGVAFLDKYPEAFERAENEFGVSKYIIAAIIGVETRYGRYLGSHRVLDALATLAFDYPPRSTFFRRELGEFFLMTREQDFDPLEVKGSYAGAMGYGQFISSSYRHYAIDFDGDKVADLLTNPVDAIGSVANYFARHGWGSGAPVAEQIRDAGALDANSALLTTGLKPSRTVSDYRTAGLSPEAGVSDDEPARAILLQGEDEPQLWLTYKNFYVITRYNHSHLYGMAVLELSDALRSLHEESS
ncbi:MAG: lytic murein transglycosylase B [Marinobacter sp.]|uniref:lytic murein transglycosylase B n=1 Tax=Marinobacter sp. TaxID=50741 RepID=UPI00349FE7B6